MLKLHLRLACTLTAVLALAHCDRAPERPDAADAQGAADCCVLAPSANLPADTGRLVVRYPDGAAPPTRVNVHAAGDAATMGGSWGDASIELPPGRYDVTIGGKRIDAVRVQAGYDTTVKVGVLQVYALDATRIDFVDAASGETLTGGYGEQSYGFPVGPVGVKVAGQVETMLIEDGKITDAGARLGRVAVTYPVEVSDARMDVYLAGDSRAIAGGYSHQELDLLPGTYDIEISGKRVTGVTVRSGQRSPIAVGVLRARAPAATRVEVLDEGTGNTVVWAYGDKLFGLPIGRYGVRIGGEIQNVTIAEQLVTEL